MASGLSSFVQTLRRVAERQSLADQSDGQLLERFVVGREQAAFEVLVRRHGGMVLSLCRRLARSSEDADDTFQATFMLLARKANAIRRCDAVGAWLYKVALRLAVRARARAAQRASCEQYVGNLAEVTPVSDRPVCDLRPVLDEEIARLPEKYRLVVILYYLEGKTVLETARLLGCPKGTVLSRLARARQQLRSRLARRGVALAGGMLAAALVQSSAQAVVPVRLTEAAVLSAMQSTAAGATAAGAVSANAVALSEGVLRAMMWCKVRFLTAFALGITFLVGGTGVFAYRAAVAQTSVSPDTSGLGSFGVPAPEALTPAPDTAQSPSPSSDKLASAPGWMWLLTPRPTKSKEWSHGGVVCLVEADKEGAQLVYLAYNGRFEPSHEQYRPVVFDAAGNRYLLKPDRGGSSGSWGRGHISMVCYRLDPKSLSHDKVAYVGVEANRDIIGK
jgi:RNA polymerase sigma factor (sigma-70 family)